MVGKIAQGRLATAQECLQLRGSISLDIAFVFGKLRQAFSLGDFSPLYNALQTPGIKVFLGVFPGDLKNPDVGGIFGYDAARNGPLEKAIQENQGAAQWNKASR